MIEMAPCPKCGGTVEEGTVRYLYANCPEHENCTFQADAGHILVLSPCGHEFPGWGWETENGGTRWVQQLVMP